MPLPVTLLEIDGISFSDYSNRDIRVQLTPIDTGSLERTVNGTLVDMTLPQFQKYQAQIECLDHEAPTFDDTWRGTEVEVTFIPEVGSGNQSNGTLVLTMLVDGWETNREENEAETAWTLTLVQV
jgi:hypothetical protein